MYDDFLGDAAHLFFIGCYIIFLLYSLFQFASAPVALVLFWAAQKGHQDQLHTSPADITVYVLHIADRSDHYRKQ